MTFWNKMKDDVRQGINQGVSVLKEGSTIAKEKATKMAEMGKVRYQMFLMEQKIEKNFAEIGKRIYELAETDASKAAASDPTIKKMISEAKKLEKKVKVLQNKMASLRKKIA